jgi:hypothetical protein
MILAKRVPRPGEKHNGLIAAHRLHRSESGSKIWGLAVVSALGEWPDAERLIEPVFSATMRIRSSSKDSRRFRFFFFSKIEMTLSVRAKGFILDRCRKFQKYKEGIKLGMVKVEIRTCCKGYHLGFIMGLCGGEKLGCVTMLCYEVTRGAGAV